MLKTSHKLDEQQIELLLQDWAYATRTGLQDKILANHAEDVIIFDVLPPLKYEGIVAYKKSWDEWQPESVGVGKFDLHELKITANSNIGFAYCFIQCGGTHANGKTFEGWVRATFCLEKTNHQWLVTHQHISMPLK